MQTTRIRGTLLLLAAAIATSAALGDPPADAPGWTGLTNPQDVIVARQALMAEMERLMQPLDSFTVGKPAEPADLTSAATSIAQMLLALPHLFPPTTNLNDPKSQTPVTIALPAIWQDFPTFYALAGAGSQTALAMATLTGTEQLKSGSLALRASCDACHTLFLRPYVADTVKEEDQQFDFDAIFEPAAPNNTPR